MGNCGCKGESHELDAYLKSTINNFISFLEHHKGQMNYEKNNYELAK